MDPGGWRQIVWLRLRMVFGRRRVEAELDEELEYHIGRQVDEYVAQGMPPGDAHQRALDRLGGLDTLRERCRQAARLDPLDVWQNWRTVMAVRRVNLKWVVATMAIVGALAGWVFGSKTPPEYMSTAVIMAVPAQVTMELVQSRDGRSLEQRLSALRQTIFSRTRLERLITEFNLYAEDRQRMTMQEVVEQLRANASIEIGSATETNSDSVITVSFASDNATTAMKVTERLAALLKDEGIREEERMQESTVSFLESQAEDVGRRVEAASRTPAAGRRAKLEVEVLESIYTKALTNLEEARARVNLAARQMSSRLVMIDAARLPERPSNPTRAEVTGIGGLLGLAVGVVLAGLTVFRRLWRARPSAQLEAARA